MKNNNCNQIKERYIGELPYSNIAEEEFLCITFVQSLFFLVLLSALAHWDRCHFVEAQLFSLLFSNLLYSALQALTYSLDQRTKAHPFTVIYIMSQTTNVEFEIVFKKKKKKKKNYTFFISMNQERTYNGLLPLRKKEESHHRGVGIV